MMGLTQSSRKITVTNDDTRLITLSTSLAERLAQGTTDKSVAAAQNQDAQRARSGPAAYPSVSVLSKTSFSEDQPNFTFSALQMQQDKQDELQDQEAYWQKRVQIMENNHALIDQIFETEYNKAVDEITNKTVVEIENSVTPCLESSKQVMKCYVDHPREILKCAELVEQFSNCVDQRRAQIIATR